VKIHFMVDEPSWGFDYFSDYSWVELLEFLRSLHATLVAASRLATQSTMTPPPDVLDTSTGICGLTYCEEFGGEPTEYPTSSRGSSGTLRSERSEVTSEPVVSTLTMLPPTAAGSDLGETRIFDESPPIDYGPELGPELRGTGAYNKVDSYLIGSHEYAAIPGMEAIPGATFIAARPTLCGSLPGGRLPKMRTDLVRDLAEFCQTYTARGLEARLLEPNHWGLARGLLYSHEFVKHPPLPGRDVLRQGRGRHKAGLYYWLFANE